ncbi:MAG: polysaccharide deacetylase family protein [Armatimonadota bacterium]
MTDPLRLAHVLVVAGRLCAPAHAAPQALLTASVGLHRVDHNPHETVLHVRAYVDDDRSVRVRLSLEGGFPRETQVTRLPRMASVTMPAMRMPSPRMTLPVGRAGLQAIHIGQVAEGRDFVRVQLDLVRGARVQASCHEGLPEIPIKVRLGPSVSRGSSRRIALTFDDTPFPATTPELLAMLARYDAPATFFVVGQKAEWYPELILHAFDAGHSIQNHSYSHTPLTDVGTEQALRELTRCNDAIESITGVTPTYFRPPGGHRNRSVVSLARQAGLNMVLWDVNPNDMAVTDPDRITRTVLRDADPNDIIALHDGAPGTMAALPTIIQALRGRGYSFVTLDELLEQRP